MRQLMQAILYQTGDAGVSIRHRIQDSLLQTADAGVIYQTAGAGETLITDA